MARNKVSTLQLAISTCSIAIRTLGFLYYVRLRELAGFMLYHLVWIDGCSQIENHIFPSVYGAVAPRDRRYQVRALHCDRLSVADRGF